MKQDRRRSITSSPARQAPTPRMRRSPDQRDHYIDQLSQLMDIRVVTDNQNQVSIFTNSGVQLVGAERGAAVVQSPGHGRPTTLWNADPTKSNLGTLLAGVAERHHDRPDRQPFDPLGQDRRLSRHARQRAGAGAEPARRPGRDDGAGAVERHHRRNRRHRRRAERIFASTPSGLLERQPASI